MEPDRPNVSGRPGRLVRPAEFQATLRGKRVATSDFFELWMARPASPQPSARVGLAISKKSAPLAVTRNLVKRIARESARAASPLEPIDLVLRARPGIGRAWVEAKRNKSTAQFRAAIRVQVDGLFARVRERSAR